jgi:hypothetical protein
MGLLGLLDPKDEKTAFLQKLETTHPNTATNSRRPEY